MISRLCTPLLIALQPANCTRNLVLKASFGGITIILRLFLPDFCDFFLAKPHKEDLLRKKNHKNPAKISRDLLVLLIQNSG
jgi:hypothetical protein